VLCTYSAKGGVPPPMVLYPYKRIPTSILAMFPEDWVIGRSDSGWMVSSTFYEYISNGFFPWLIKNNIQFPVILFLDGHKSHLSLELAEFCAANKIILYCLPPNSTHIMQPCDVAIFKPLKASWKSVVGKNKRSGNPITKTNFVNYFKEAFNSVQTSSITNGFRKCRLYPFNADAVDYSKCISYRRKILYPTSNNELDILTIEQYKITLKVLEKYLGKTNIEQFESKLLNPLVPIKNVSSLFDFWNNIKQNICMDNLNIMDIDNMPIEFDYDNACRLNENNQSFINSMTEHEDVIPLGIINLGNIFIFIKYYYLFQIIMYFIY